jgi:hypothetical protein
MTTAELIQKLAEKISEEGNQELGDYIIINNNYGDMEIESFNFNE